jgi:hypothetical protein
MKKSLIKSKYQLQIINDGSSFFIWTHPLKSRLTLLSKDISQHPLWDIANKKDSTTKITSIEYYTKSFKFKID